MLYQLSYIGEVEFYQKSKVMSIKAVIKRSIFWLRIRSPFPQKKLQSSLSMHLLRYTRLTSFEVSGYISIRHSRMPCNHIDTDNFVKFFYGKGDLMLHQPSYISKVNFSNKSDTNLKLFIIIGFYFRRLKIIKPFSSAKILNFFLRNFWRSGWFLQDSRSVIIKNLGLTGAYLE